MYRANHANIELQYPWSRLELPLTSTCSLITWSHDLGNEEANRACVAAVFIRGVPLDERQSATELDEVLQHHHIMQEKLAEDMLHLARNLKNNTMAAQSIIKQDNQVGRWTLTRSNTKLCYYGCCVVGGLPPTNSSRCPSTSLCHLQKYRHSLFLSVSASHWRLNFVFSSLSVSGRHLASRCGRPTWTLRNWRQSRSAWSSTRRRPSTGCCGWCSSSSPSPSSAWSSSSESSRGSDEDGDNESGWLFYNLDSSGWTGSAVSAWDNDTERMAHVCTARCGIGATPP